MPNGEAVNWLINISADIGKAKHSDLWHYEQALSEIREMLETAQPEIIRCKDCKHRDPEDKKCDCGHDIQWQLPRQDDWYCADAKRRTE